jgi:alpha-glucoside transport system ATP-binding protein
MANMIDIEKLNAWFGENHVLKDVDFKVPINGSFGLVGESGSGKSTVLRTITGLVEDWEGNILVNNKELGDKRDKDFYRLVQMVFQDPFGSLHPRHTIDRILTEPVNVHGLGDSDKRVIKVLEQVGLDNSFRFRYPHQLSGGQRQRVAIGRAIVRDPKVFLFDEPLSNLDAALRVATRIEIAQLKESMPDRTMIYVTHDQVEAMTLATRIVVLANKGIAQVGSPLDLYERPENEFVAQFIGSPAMNLIPGKITATGARTEVTLENGVKAYSAVPTQESDLGRKVNIGVRPEDFKPGGEQDCCFTGKVAITEKLGEVTLMYFEPQSGRDAVIAKLPGIHNGLRASTVTLAADPEKIHLFADGRSLLYR